MITNVDKRIAEALNKDEEYWTFKEDAERDYVHGLFAYPAMMVPKMQREILEVCLAQSENKRPKLLDPFAGSGTTLYEAARKGINPKTKEQIDIPACKVPTFKFGKSFKELIK